MHPPQNVGMRLSSLTEHHPIYSATHTLAGIALLKIVDYEEWVCAETKELLSWLHGVHLLIDGMVANYNFYKVDFTAGIFTIAANISGPENPNAADDLLQFAVEVIKSLREVKSPLKRTPLKCQIALNSGPIQTAILGKTALKFGIHGKTEIITRQLLQCIRRGQHIIASIDFINGLSTSSASESWTKVPNKGNTLVQEVYIYNPFSNLQESVTDVKMKQSFFLCFAEPAEKKKFYSLQAQWLIGADFLYFAITLSTLLPQINSGFGYLLSFALVLLFSFFGLKTKLYTNHRKTILSLYYFVGMIINQPSNVCYLAQAQWILPELSFVQMQTIASFLLFPFQATFTICALIFWMLTQYLSCTNQELVQVNVGEISLGCLSQIFFVFLIPSYISCSIEQYQRQQYIQASQVEKSKGL